MDAHAALEGISQRALSLHLWRLILVSHRWPTASLANYLCIMGSQARTGLFSHRPAAIRATCLTAIMTNLGTAKSPKTAPLQWHSYTTGDPGMSILPWSLQFFLRAAPEPCFPPAVAVSCQGHRCLLQSPSQQQRL